MSLYAESPLSEVAGVNPVGKEAEDEETLFILGLGKRYPIELLRSAVHKLLFPLSIDKLTMHVTTTIYISTICVKKTISDLGHLRPKMLHTAGD